MKKTLDKQSQLDTDRVLALSWYADYGKRTYDNLSELLKIGLSSFDPHRGAYRGAVCLVGGSPDYDRDVLKILASRIAVMSVGRGVETVYREKVSCSGAIGVDPFYAPKFSVERLFCLGHVNSGFAKGAREVVLAGVLDEQSKLYSHMVGENVPLYRAKGTSVTIALEFAKQMGFKKVYLVGFEHVVSEESPCAICVEGKWTQRDFQLAIQSIEKFISKNPELSVVHVNQGGFNIKGCDAFSMPDNQKYDVPDKKVLQLSWSASLLEKEISQMLEIVNKSLKTMSLPQLKEWNAFNFYRLHVFPLWLLWNHRFPKKHLEFYELMFIKEVCEQFTSSYPVAPKVSQL